jgi:hypothetical protein
MNDLIIRHDDAGMSDMPFVILEESQVAGQGIIQEVNSLTPRDLL